MIKYDEKTNSKTLSLDDKITIYKNNRGVKFDNFDVIAISEWISTKSSEEQIYGAFRTIALLCAVVDGFEDVFFEVAKNMPKNIQIKNPTIDEIFEVFEDVNKEALNPYDYIKALQNVFKSAPKTSKMFEDVDDTFLEEKLSEIKSKFKLVSSDEALGDADGRDEEEKQKSSFVQLLQMLDDKTIVNRYLIIEPTSYNEYKKLMEGTR